MIAPARLVAAAVAVLLVTATGVLAAPPAGSTRAERRLYYVLDLLDTTTKQVERAPACRPHPPDRAPATTLPSDDLLTSLAPFRRPEQPEDRAAQEGPGALFRRGQYTDYVRVAHAGDGTAFTLVPVRDANRFKPRPARCLSALRRRFGRAIADRPDAFRREARHQLRREITVDWPSHPREGVLVFVEGSGTGTTLARLRQRGVLLLRAGFTTPDAAVYAVVPDGVATIDFTFRRFEPTGYWSKHHPITYEITVAVQDNVVAFHAPRTLRDVALSSQVWRASDGHVIRVTSGG
jgi:hypothetical protein